MAPNERKTEAAPLPDCALDVVVGGGVKLRNVLVSSYQTGGPAGATPPAEEIGFVFHTIR